MEAASFPWSAPLCGPPSEAAGPCLVKHQEPLGGLLRPSALGGVSIPLSQLGTVPDPSAFFGTCAWALLGLTPQLFRLGSCSPWDTQAGWWLVGSGSCSAPLQKDPRVPGRGFLAGLEHLTASISAGPGRPPGATTLRGLQGSVRQLESYTFPLGYLFLFACCEAFRFLYSLPKSNHKILGNFA